MGYLTFREKHKIPTYDNAKHMQTGKLDFDPDKCNQCGRCISVCPGGSIISENFTKIDYMAGTNKGKCGTPSLESIKPGVTLCIACYCCGAACPREAISIASNFNPGYYFKRITQTSDMKFPKRY